MSRHSGLVFDEFFRDDGKHPQGHGEHDVIEVAAAPQNPRLDVVAVAEV